MTQLPSSWWFSSLLSGKQAASQSQAPADGPGHSTISEDATSTRGDSPGSQSTLSSRTMPVQAREQRWPGTIGGGIHGPPPLTPTLQSSGGACGGAALPHLTLPVNPGTPPDCYAPRGSTTSDSELPALDNAEYYEAAKLNSQIWPLIDAVMSPYPTEAKDDDGDRECNAGFLADGDELPSSGVATYPEGHQGPAIFQGFQPPPSYAWGRLAPEAPAVEDLPVEEPGPPLVSEAEVPVKLARQKCIDMASPLRSGSREPSGAAAFGAVLDELRRCQSFCSHLRVEKRGVPAVEVERWCDSIAEQLSQIGNRLGEKLEGYKKKSQAKDETIKRLFRRLQAADPAATQARAEHSLLPGATRHSVRSPASSTGLRRPASEKRMGEPSPTRPANAKTRGLEVETQLSQGGRREAATPPSWTPAGPGPHLGRGRLQGANDDVCLGEELEAAALPAMLAVTPPATPLEASRTRDIQGGRVSTPQASPLSSSARASSSTHLAIEEKHLAALRARRAHDTSLKPGRAQAVMAGRSEADRGQQVHLRREVAHLRRRDVDLGGQLRARELQVEQLTSTLRELQLVTQRQIGLYKRQLQLKDTSLQALQEELMQQQASGSAVAAAALSMGASSHMGVVSGSFPASAVEATRSNRRHSTQAHSSQVPSGAAGGGASGTSSTAPGGNGGAGAGAVAAQGHSVHDLRRSCGATPRAYDGDSGRHSGVSATWPVPKKESRERSLGAMPHSPRSKNREMPTAHVNSHQIAAEAIASSRRRMSPTASGTAQGRATSVEERKVRSRHEAEIAVAAAATKAMRLRESQHAPRHRR